MTDFLRKKLFKNKIVVGIFIILIFGIGVYFVYNTFLKEIKNVFAVEASPTSGCFKINFGNLEIQEQGGTYKIWSICPTGIFLSSDYWSSGGSGTSDFSYLGYPYSYKLDHNNVLVLDNLQGDYDYHNSITPPQANFLVRSVTNGLLAYVSRDLESWNTIGLSSFVSNPSSNSGSFKIETNITGQKRTLLYFDSAGMHYRLGLLNQNKPLTNVIDFSMGGEHSCAITSDNKLYCWGNDTYGQAGVSMYESPTSTLFGDCLGYTRCYREWAANYPYNVHNAQTYSAIKVPLENVKKISCGYSHTCAIAGLFTENLYCWGDNTNSQAQCSAWGVTSTPKYIMSLANYSSISSGLSFSWVKDGNLIRRGGPNFCGVDGTPEIINQSGVISIDANSDANFGCVVVNGSPDLIKCWSHTNYYGALLGSFLYYHYYYPYEYQTATSTLVNVLPAISQYYDISKVSVGMSHACFLRTSGEVRCWGMNNHGQLATFSDLSHTHPIDTGGNLYPHSGHSNIPLVINLGGVATDISTGPEYSCAIVGGQVKCWGYDSTALDSLTPGAIVTISGINNATKIISRSGVSCALISQETVEGIVSNGVIKCWGSTTKLKRASGINRLPTSVLIPTYVTIPYFYNIDLTN